MANHLIIVNADENENFTYRAPGGKDAFSQSIVGGDNIAWICFVGGGDQLGYSISFPNGSPFEQKTIYVPNGGHSGFFKAVYGKYGDFFKYEVTIPSLDWHDDPEVLIDAVGITLVTERLVDGRHIRIKQTELPRTEIGFRRSGNIVSFDSNSAPDVTGSRVRWYCRTGGPYSIIFPDGASPFDLNKFDAPANGHTPSPLATASQKGVYKYKVIFSDDNLTVDAPGVEIK